MSAKKNPLKKPVSTAAPAMPFLPYLLAAIAFLLYANTLNHGFALDDRAVTHMNRFVTQGISAIPKLLTTFYWEGFWDNNAGLYRPLSMIQFAIEWQLGGGKPFLFHFMNVALYALSIALLYQVLRRLMKDLSPWLPFCIALLFAMHPMHTEVVANIKSRDEILCFLFFLTTALILLKPIMTTRDKILASISYLACLLSKEGGMVYLPVFGLMLMLFKKESIGIVIRKLIPLIAVFAGWLIIHEAVIRGNAHSKITYSYLDNSLVACGDAGSRLATGIGITGRYLAKSLVPYEMSYDYSYSQVPCESFGSSLVVISIAAIITLLFLAWNRRQAWPVFSFGIFYFFINIILYSNTVMLIGATMADRFVYSASLGILIATVFLVFRMIGSQVSATNGKFAFLLILPVAALYGWKTVDRNKLWKDDTTLFLNDVNVSTGSARTHFNAGTVLMDAAQQAQDTSRNRLFSACIEEFKQAVTIDPNDGGSYNNMGVAYFRIKDFANSIRATRRAMELKPEDASLNGNLADAYFMSEQPDSAIVYYQQCIRKNVVTVYNYDFLGTSFIKKNEMDSALHYYRQGLDFDSTYAQLWLNYGNALGMTKQYREAITAFETAFRLDPTMKNALYYLYLTYLNLGEKAKADAYLERFKRS